MKYLIPKPAILNLKMPAPNIKKGSEIGMILVLLAIGVAVLLVKVDVVASLVFLLVGVHGLTGCPRYPKISNSCVRCRPQEICKCAFTCAVEPDDGKH